MAFASCSHHLALPPYYPHFHYLSLWQEGSLLPGSRLVELRAGQVSWAGWSCHFCHRHKGAVGAHSQLSSTGPQHPSLHLGSWDFDAPAIRLPFPTTLGDSEVSWFPDHWTPAPLCLVHSLIEHLLYAFLHSYFQSLESSGKETKEWCSFPSCSVHSSSFICIFLWGLGPGGGRDNWAPCPLTPVWHTPSPSCGSWPDFSDPKPWGKCKILLFASDWKLLL